MNRSLFIRNLRGSELIERFLVAAISSLLLLRFYLYLTGYPQVGGGNLHIAHMLWGGVLMLVAFMANFAFIGIRMQRLTAIIGGAGFGIFIDEIGKFLTKDNNYFFRPSIGIIYAVFVVIYLVSNFLSNRTRFVTSREYQINALVRFEEAVLNDMDPAEKAHVALLLSQADQTSPLTRELKKMLASVNAVKAAKPNVLERLLRRLNKLYDKLWTARSSNYLVRAFFLAETILFMFGVIATLYNNFDAVQDLFSGQITYGHTLVFGQLFSTLLATGYAVFGVIRLPVSRIEAFEYFRKATLVNLLLTEFFIFSRIQFGAMPGFIFNLILLTLVTAVLTQEQKRAQLTEQAST